MIGQTPDQEMIAVPFRDALQPLYTCINNLCQCIRDYAQQPGSAPCNQYPLYYRGSVAQTFVCHVATAVFQVPKGQTAVVTRVALTERYPGTLYGANLMLLENDNFVPNFPRMDHTVGGLETGKGTRVCFEEQSIISVMIQCSWFPASFTGMASTYTQTLFPFEIEGFFEYKVLE